MRKPGRMQRLRFRTLWIVLAAGTSLAQISSPSHSGGPPGRLEAVVLDENGVAVRSALAVLIPPSPGPPLRCETDFAGHCAFSALSPGSYQLRVEKQGFYASVPSGGRSRHCGHC